MSWVGRARGPAAALTTVTIMTFAFTEAAGAADVVPSPRWFSGASASVSSCGAVSGISISWTSTANVVTTVALGSIPAACLGGSLHLTLVGAGQAALGAVGPVVITGTNQSMSPLTGAPSASAVIGAFITVVGA